MHGVREFDSAMRGEDPAASPQHAEWESAPLVGWWPLSPQTGRTLPCAIAWPAAGAAWRLPHSATGHYV